MPNQYEGIPERSDHIFLENWCVGSLRYNDQQYLLVD
jgi:hypothetical protein